MDITGINDVSKVQQYAQQPYKFQNMLAQRFFRKGFNVGSQAGSQAL